MQAAERLTTDGDLLAAFRTIDSGERRKHETVLDYWLTIRGAREFPSLHDLDPLEISEAGPSSILLELIGGGEDAEIRFLGAALNGHVDGDRISTAPRPSILASIAKKLSIVAISRNFLAFEDEFTTGDETTRCWTTLFPLSAAGAWVDYVYALVSIETGPADAGREPDAAHEIEAELPEAEPLELKPEAMELEQAADFETDPIEEPALDEDDHAEPADDLAAGPQAIAGAGKVGPGFTKLLESLAGLGGFYATHAAEAEVSFPVDAEAEEHADPSASDDTPAGEETAEAACEHTEEPADVPREVDSFAEAPEPITDDMEEPAAVVEEPEPAATEPDAIADQPEAPHALDDSRPVAEPTPALEGTLQSKLADVRAKADEARMAKLRANAALYEGLSAAYDFALDAEDAPEEYLQIVQAQGLKIQLRAPMKPVVKLAFDGLCDEPTIAQLEAVLAWAFKQELPRGTLAERLEAEGGIAHILNGEAKAA
jgi:hypothetical protein